MKKIVLALLVWLAALNGFSQSLSDSAQLRAFMDGVMLTNLRNKHIAGATVSVVHDGAVVLARSYGFADVRTQRPVRPDSTLFRVGSISKLFTWICVMQLVAQGKLKLDADVNTYLTDFKVPSAYSQPITLKHLMTHTAGFEDHVIGLFSRDSSSLKPLGDILEKELPARVYPPGEVASYSNHGAGLAAYIVEKVSGKNFNDYVENNILIPLRMNMTTFRQPLPVFLKPMMSKGYSDESNEWKEQPFEFVPLYPIGGASTSAMDMARFMTAILNDGRFNGITILDSATLHFMLTPAHRHHPAVNPMLYGFMDLSRNGVRVFGHGGDTFWFHSLMVLFPDFRTGLFISVNTSSGGVIMDDVLEEFIKNYFPERNSLRLPITVSSRFLKRFDGSYRPDRYNRHDITMLASLFGDMRIEAVDSLKLKVTGWDKVEYYVPVDSLTFREEHSSATIGFKKNQDGKITRLFIGNFPAMALDKVTGAGNKEVHLSVAILVLMTTIMILFYWPITWRARIGYEAMGHRFPMPPGAKFVGWTNYFLIGAFYAGMVIAIGDPLTIVYGIPTSLKVILFIPFAVILLTFVMYLQLYRIWTQRKYSTGRIYYLLITLVSTAALWQMYYWNFIGFRY